MNDVANGEAILDLQVKTAVEVLNQLGYSKDKINDVISCKFGEPGVGVLLKLTEAPSKKPRKEVKSSEGQMAYRAYMKENLPKERERIITENPELTKGQVQREAMKAVGSSWTKMKGNRANETVSEPEDPSDPSEHSPSPDVPKTPENDCSPIPVSGPKKA